MVTDISALRALCGLVHWFLPIYQPYGLYVDWYIGFYRYISPMGFVFIWQFILPTFQPYGLFYVWGSIIYRYISPMGFMWIVTLVSTDMSALRAWFLFGNLFYLYVSPTGMVIVCKFFFKPRGLKYR